eukprot:6458920-Amphidinium_carterae.1
MTPTKQLKSRKNTITENHGLTNEKTLRAHLTFNTLVPPPTCTSQHYSTLNVHLKLTAAALPSS